VSARVDGRPRQFSVHALVAEAFIGPRPPGLVVNHKNFDRADNRVKNLEYVSQKRNVHHAIEAGRVGWSDRRNVHLKLTEEQVLEIRAALKCGVMQKVLAEEYHVTDRTISDIKTRRTWTHI